jgi:hypothetical protein
MARGESYRKRELLRINVLSGDISIIPTGTGITALLQDPVDVAVDADGNILATDLNKGLFRIIDGNPPEVTHIIRLEPGEGQVHGVAIFKGTEANAGPDQSVPEASAVTLDGSASAGHGVT